MVPWCRNAQQTCARCIHLQESREAAVAWLFSWQVEVFEYALEATSGEDLHKVSEG
jgi:hypothetical protein